MTWLLIMSCTNTKPQRSKVGRIIDKALKPDLTPRITSNSVARAHLRRKCL